MVNDVETVLGHRKFCRQLLVVELGRLTVPQARQHLHGRVVEFVARMFGIAAAEHVPKHRRKSTGEVLGYGRRAFSMAGPMVWNLLPDHLRDPSLNIGSFRSARKTFLFTMHWDIYAVEALLRNALYKSTIIIIIGLLYDL